MHGKSLLAISYCVRKICMDRNISILFISASAGQAEKRVRLIKQFLESEKIISDWANGNDIPAFKGSDAKWTSTQLYVQREGTAVDPTLEAIGSGGKITGAHVDIVIIDDLEDDTTTGSAGVRSKTREWLNATVTPILNQGGLMIVIGTRKHADDAYEHMKKDPTFTVIEDPAIIKWPTKYEYCVEKDENGREVLKGVKYTNDYKVLWPEYRDLDYLLLERRSMGTTLFAREMQNEVIAVEDSIIKPEWVDACTTATYELGNIPVNLNLDDCSIIQCWDLSIESDAKKAATNDSDFTVGFTLARDKKGCIWILDVFRDRGLTQTEILSAILQKYDKWKEYVSTVVVEKNSFGNLYIQQLQTTSLPVKAVAMTRHNSLKSGIHKIAVLFENNLFKIPVGNEFSRQFLNTFAEEASQYPFAKHDDTLSSLFHGINELQTIRGNYIVSVGDKIFTGKGEEITEKNKTNDIVNDVLEEIGLSSSEYSDEEKKMLERFGLGEFD